MSLAVLYRRRKVGSVDDESTLSMMESLFVALALAADLYFDASPEVVEGGACNCERDGKKRCVSCWCSISTCVADCGGGGATTIMSKERDAAKVSAMAVL